MNARLLVPSLLLLGACAHRAAPPAPAPAPARDTTPVVIAPPVTVTAPLARGDTLRQPLREPPREWQLLDDSLDHLPGISADRAYREVLAGRQPARTVVVAVIDGGVDTAHVDLRANLWTNPGEVAGNHVDDDHDGYVDDVHGWNFLGGKDGRDVDFDNLELTRLYRRCSATRTGARQPPLPVPVPCDSVTRDFHHSRERAVQSQQQVAEAGQVLDALTAALRPALGDSITPERVEALRPTDAAQQQARTVFLQLAAQGLTPKTLAEARKEVDTQVKYQLNPQYDPRPIVGDDYADPTQRVYGNGDVTGPDAMHGTHVAGIIGAVRGNGVGVDGVASAVRLMSVRAVPDGDERDKDVANAIRFAVDHGAQVINMSFGKSYSPYKPVVDDAVRYADQHGVLMVHAAGNDGKNLASYPNFPSRHYRGGGTAQNWIEVGASGWHAGDSLVTSFSNYNQSEVDLFAPGEDILSTVPGGGYDRLSGTSMAAPVVTGVAALLMSYYPELTAADVKRILLASASRRHASQQVLLPGGSGERVPFSQLSATGGIVNALAAVRMAEAQHAAAGAPRP